MINGPIGVFDSGVGGFSVLKELYKLMPAEDFVYYGDSANAPYGSKSLEEVRALTLKATEKLLEYKAKAIVIACNTATSAAIRMLREKYPHIPIVGLEPALKPAITFMNNPTVLVLATPMTLREEKFHKLAEQYENRGTIVPVPCEHLAEIIESGNTEGEKIEKYLYEILAPQLDKHPDAAVLGCTHYPLAYNAIKKTLGSNVRIFDGGEGAARETLRRLSEKGLNKECGTGSIEYLSSKNAKQLKEFAERFINNGL